MDILPEPITFEWDKGNQEKSLHKHNVSIAEAEEVFDNKQKFFFRDAKHSSQEKRIGLYGKTDKNRKL